MKKLHGIARQPIDVLGVRFNKAQYRMPQVAARHAGLRETGQP